MNAGTGDGQQFNPNYNRPSANGAHNNPFPKPQYRMKRPYTMMAINDKDLGLSTFSGKKFKYQSEHDSSVYSYNSAESKKSLPVFSMNHPGYKGNGDVEMHQSGNLQNNLTVQSDLKRNYTDKMTKIKNEMAIYQNQVKRNDDPGIFYYDDCCDKTNFNY